MEGKNIQFSGQVFATCGKCSIDLIILLTTSFLSYNLMASLQKLVNLFVVVICTAFLIYLNSNINTVSLQQNQVLELTTLIANGVALSEEQSQTISSILSTDNQQFKKNSQYCFLKAYQSVVLIRKLDPQNLFSIFEPGKQFAGVSTCIHYYQLLIYRASLLEGKQKVRIQNILNNLLEKQFQNRKQSPICVNFYAYNSETTVKQQITNIVAQNYDDLKVIVSVDASKDNTHMFVKYMLEENKQKTDKFTIDNSPQRKGLIANFEKNECQQDSIVVLLDRNAVLLSQHSLSMINAFFANNPNNKIAVFKSLTTTRQNIQNNSVSSFYPVLAFRKQALPKLKVILDRISAQTKQNLGIIDYQYQLLTWSVLNSQDLAKEIGLSPQAIVYRSARKPTQQQVLSNLMLTK